MRFYENIPYSVVVITTKFKDRINLMTAIWHTPLSIDPPMYGFLVKRSRYTYDMLKNSGEFTASFVTLDKIDLALKVGTFSGKFGDKVKIFNLESELQNSETISPPFLKSSYLVFECKMVNEVETGDHVIIISDILKVHKLKNLLKAKPVVYLNYSEYTTIVDEVLYKISNELRKEIQEAMKRRDEV